MKLHSFRLRIAALSALLAGTTLMGFAGFSWWLIYQTKLNRIDQGIKNQLLQESDRPRPLGHWSPYATALQVAFGTNASAHLALLVQNSDDKTIYQSDTWTPALTQAAKFPTLNLPPQRQETTSPRRPLPPPDRPPPPFGQGFPSPGQPRFPEEQFGQPPGPPEDVMGMPRPPHQLSKLVTQSTRTGVWRLGTVTAPYVRIAIAVNLQTIDSEMDAIRNAFLLTIPPVWMLIGIGSWWLSGSSLQTIREVTSTLRRVTAKGLDQRVPVSGADCEFVELLQVFNQMMERLERSFNQASRFSADAAHELKTPLSILQGELERTLQAANPGSELQQRLSNLLDEVHHLGAIVRKLLLLSLADAGQMRLHTVEVDLAKLLADLVEDIEMLAPELEVQVQVDPSLKVHADQALLIQVLQNLISNATKYNLPGGWVRIEAGQRQRDVFVTVTNCSQDIPASERSRIFDRFHRGEPARTHQIEGLGLGLSLSREIALAHGGNLTLDPPSMGETAFTLTLPSQMSYRD